MKNNTLKLKNLKNTYIQTNTGKRNKVYYDGKQNNIILIAPLNKDVDEDQICNGIRNSAYIYLMNALNKNKNVVVIWSAVSGTSSDYNIYYDIYSEDMSKKSFNEIIKSLNDVTDNHTTMKYNEIRNKIMIPIENI